MAAARSATPPFLSETPKICHFDTFVAGRKSEFEVAIYDVDSLQTFLFPY